MGPRGPPSPPQEQVEGRGALLVSFIIPSKLLHGSLHKEVLFEKKEMCSPNRHRHIVIISALLFFKRNHFSDIKPAIKATFRNATWRALGTLAFILNFQILTIHLKVIPYATDKL